MAKKKKTALEKNLKKQSKVHPVALIIVVGVLICGLFAGWFSVKYLTKNDKFEIVGQQNITLNLGEEYIDEGAIAVSFGKDVSTKIKMENNIDKTKVGRYYIKYTVDDLRYKNVVRYRYIIYLDEVADE